MQTLTEMREALKDAAGTANGILERCKNDKRAMTAEEETEFDNAMGEADRLKDLITREERVGNLLEDGGEETETRGETRGGRRSQADQINRQTQGELGERSLTVDVWNAIEHRMEKAEILLSDERARLAKKEYREAFNTYLRSGQAPAEDRALNLQQGDQGGFIAPMAVSSRFLQVLDDMNWMRQISDTVTVSEAGSLGVMGIDTDPSDAAWTSEITSTDAAADSTMKFGRRELTPHLLIKRLDVSRTMLKRLAMAERYVMDRLAYVVASTEEAAFIEGTGANQPLGIFTASDDGIGTGRDIVSGSSGALSADGVINAFYNIKEPYRRNARWVMSREAIKRARKLKGSDNNYLWRPGLAAGEPAELLGRPVHEAENAPGHDTSNDWDNGDYVAVFGDFRFYMIATAVNIEFLRDQYTSAGQNKVRMLVYHESDGMPVLGEAFTRIKLGT